MGWQNGRQLASATNGTNSLSFEYDVNGIRTSKTINGVKHTYLYNGTQLVSESFGNTRYEFRYDANGAPFCVLVYNNNAFALKCYYLLNLQGDVVGLMNSAGAMSAYYTYDAWGNVTSVKSASGTELPESHFAYDNPLLYRGYYYDRETGLYYCQSRYYDPEVSRFINADGYVTTEQDALCGVNMFCYCGNSPVNRRDSSGMFWEELEDWFKNTYIEIKNCAKSIFGSGTTVVYQKKQEVEHIPGIANMFLTVKTGVKESITIDSNGDTTKPVSVYVQSRLDNTMLSSGGLKINIFSTTASVNFGADNIGVAISNNKGNRTNSFSITLDLTQVKVGVEGSTTIKWNNNTSGTTYTNVSITGWGLLATYLYLTTGQWCPSPAIAQ